MARDFGSALFSGMGQQNVDPPQDTPPGAIVLEVELLLGGKGA